MNIVAMVVVALATFALGHVVGAVRATARHEVVRKVWFDRLWFMYGAQDRSTPIFTKAWIKSVLPPYYEGHGLAIRLRNHSIRIGVCSMLGSHDDWEQDPTFENLEVEAHNAGAELVPTPIESIIDPDEWGQQMLTKEGVVWDSSIESESEQPSQ